MEMSFPKILHSKNVINDIVNNLFCYEIMETPPKKNKTTGSYFSSENQQFCFESKEKCHCLLITTFQKYF